MHTQCDSSPPNDSVGNFETRFANANLMPFSFGTAKQHWILNNGHHDHIFPLVRFWDWYVVSAVISEWSSTPIDCTHRYQRCLSLYYHCLCCRLPVDWKKRRRQEKYISNFFDFWLSLAKLNHIFVEWKFRRVALDIDFLAANSCRWCSCLLRMIHNFRLSNAHNFVSASRIDEDVDRQQTCALAVIHQFAFAMYAGVISNNVM